MARKRPRDPDQLAWQLVQEATGAASPPAQVLDTRNPAAVVLSKPGAAKGGRARAAKRNATARKGNAAPRGKK
jgi:hypothetical protein